MKRIDKHAAAIVKKKTATEKQLESDDDLIAALRECISAGPIPKNEMVSKVNKEAGFSHRQIRQVLKRYTGHSYADGARWKEEKGDNNKSVFTLLHPPSIFS